ASACASAACTPLLRSFPTRRSSDLYRSPAAAAARGERAPDRGGAVQLGCDRQGPAPPVPGAGRGDRGGGAGVCTRRRRGPGPRSRRAHRTAKDPGREVMIRRHLKAPLAAVLTGGGVAALARRNGARGGIALACHNIVPEGGG